MATHTSATPREEKSHNIDASLKRRARLLITNSSIPSKTRSMIRYALELKDPNLRQLVNRVEEGELTIDHRIEQAAVVSHQSVNEFVVTSLLRVAEETLGRKGVIQLSKRDRDLFLTALETDVPPNRSLRNAAERFKRSFR